MIPLVKTSFKLDEDTYFFTLLQCLLSNFNHFLSKIVLEKQKKEQ